MTTNNPATQPVEAPELKPCPFCPDGGKPYFTKSVNGTNMAYVGCAQCGLQLKAQVQFLTSREDWRLSKDIVSIWNTRTPAPDIAEKARLIAEQMVPACLARTCFIKQCDWDECSGCDDSEAERERVAAIIAVEFGGSGE